MILSKKDLHEISIVDDEAAAYTRGFDLKFRKFVAGVGVRIALSGEDLQISNVGKTEKSWSFTSPAGSSGIFYFGGFYQFHGSAFTPAGGTNVGTANSSYAAHALVVLGASSANMVVRVTGTSISDLGVRAAADTEDIDTSAGVSGSYFETSKKWIGQISYSLQSGSGVTINAGFAKYWDNNNLDFNIIGLEATWHGGANDGGANIELIYHNSAGWTYGAGGTPGRTALVGMNADHVTEINIVNNERGAWKRTNLAQAVNADNADGVLWRVTTSANKAFELGNLLLTISPFT